MGVCPESEGVWPGLAREEEVASSIGRELAALMHASGARDAHVTRDTRSVSENEVLCTQLGMSIRCSLFLMVHEKFGGDGSILDLGL